MITTRVTLSPKSYFTTLFCAESEDGNLSVTVGVTAQGGIDGTVMWLDGSHEEINFGGGVFVGDDDPVEVARTVFDETVAAYSN